MDAAAAPLLAFFRYFGSDGEADPNATAYNPPMFAYGR